MPIVAMTANAYREDRAACLAAGMDDPVAKPVDPARLYATLLRWLSAGAPASAAAVARTKPSPEAPAEREAPVIQGLDCALAIARLGGHADLYRCVLRQFVQHIGDELPNIESELTLGEAEPARQAAHSIKGASAAIGATRLPAFADAVEHAIIVGRPQPEIGKAGRVVVRELEAVVEAIRESLQTGVTQPAPPEPEPVSDLELDRLEDLLRAGDYEAATTFHQLGQRLRARFGQSLGAVEAPLRRFDYVSALRAMRVLRGSVDA